MGPRKELDYNISSVKSGESNKNEKKCLVSIKISGSSESEKEWVGDLDIDETADDIIAKKKTRMGFEFRGGTGRRSGLRREDYQVHRQKTTRMGFFVNLQPNRSRSRQYDEPRYGCLTMDLKEDGDPKKRRTMTARKRRRWWISKEEGD
ncbi:hypothetical protein QJS10_CPA16g01778 [Acorus calamus]|uniref:Uncharacterized protein n=1 Tax=Acorus calamus TaxID=4465 RepID=A0AAV9D226_ACOCL|nr:hypothetical protein QJS10_CPA16g01778 [Acorus calamus]